MQKDMPPHDMWSDCYMNGGEMNKEADGAWTLHFSGNYSNCSAEVKRVEMSHWSVKGVSILVTVLWIKFYRSKLRNFSS